MAVITPQSVPLGNLSKFKAAVKDPTRNALVACTGPSTTAGQSTGAGNQQRNIAWPTQAAAMMASLGIPAGAENVFGDKACYAAAQTAANFTAADPRVVFTGTAGPTGFNTIGGNGLTVGTAAGDTLVFTTKTPVSRFDIYWRDGSVGNGTFSAAIDGGAATNYPTTGVAQTAKTSISAGALGIHTLTLTSVANNPRIVGINAYDDTNGRREISFLNWGISGARTDQLINDTDPTSSILKAAKAVAPDLTIFDDWPINDWRQSRDVNLTRSALLTGMGVARQTGDVLLVTPIPDGGTAGLTAQQDTYVQMIRDLAKSENVALVDMRAAWDNYNAQNAAGSYSDTVHPTFSGYSFKAMVFVNFLRNVII